MNELPQSSSHRPVLGWRRAGWLAGWQAGLGGLAWPAWLTECAKGGGSQPVVVHRAQGNMPPSVAACSIDLACVEHGLPRRLYRQCGDTASRRRKLLLSKRG